MRPTFLLCQGCSSEVQTAVLPWQPERRSPYLISSSRCRLSGVCLLCCHLWTLLQLRRLQHPEHLTRRTLSLPQTTSVCQPANNNLSAGIFVIGGHAVHVVHTPSWTLNGSPCAKDEYCPSGCFYLKKKQCFAQFTSAASVLEKGIFGKTAEYDFFFFYQHKQSLSLHVKGFIELLLCL